MSEPNSDSPYHDLRQMALNLRAEDLGFEPVPDETRVFGVVLDVVTEGGAATFTAYRTGDGSMYTSPAGGMIGGFAHENVRRAAIALVECAESHFDAFTPADAVAPLPPADTARFYLVTDHGRFFADEPVEALFTATGNLPDLTAAANALFTELRVLDEAVLWGDSSERWLGSNKRRFSF